MAQNKFVVIPTLREGYSIEQVDNPITIGELIDVLQGYDPTQKVTLSFDGGYTFGSIDPDKIFERIPDDD